jgi:hypothetical protein
MAVFQMQINFLSRSIRTIYRKYSDFMIDNEMIKLLIYKQHKFFSMPIFLFDLLFRYRLLKYLFNFYGYHVWLSSYSKRDGDNISYWLSRQSLYWHLWRQTDDDGKSIVDIMLTHGIKDCLLNDNLVALEAGFGIGKNYFRNHKVFSNFDKYIAVELNSYCCDYVNKRYNSFKSLSILNMSMRQFINSSTTKFDIFICAGGVLLCLDNDTVNLLFKILPERGVKAVIILNEGTDKEDIFRSDNTTIYNIKKRLIMAGYQNKQWLEKKKDDDIYEYFVMF